MKSPTILPAAQPNDEFHLSSIGGPTQPATPTPPVEALCSHRATDLLIPTVTNRTILAPCRGMHSDLLGPTRQEQTWCANLASQISKLPLSNVPEVCLPRDSLDFSLAVTSNYHESFLGLHYDHARENVHLFAGIASGVFSDHAHYLFQSNRIILNPAQVQYTQAMVGNSATLSVLTHEMTHAIQAELYPQLFEHLIDIQDQTIQIYNDALTQVFNWWNGPKSLFGVLAWPRSSATFYRQLWSAADQKSLPLILLEGHAMWVETQASPFFRSANAQPPGRWKSWKFWLQDPLKGPFRAATFHSMGLRLVEAVQKLQNELTRHPFLDDQGRLVTLDPSLLRRGLLDVLFQDLTLVDALLPFRKSGWLPRTKEYVDIAPLRKRIVAMDSHVVAS